MATILQVIPEDWFFWSHRRALASAVVAAGHQLVVATPERNHGAAIRDLGCKVVPLVRLSRESRRPDREVAAMTELVSIYRAVRPDLVHHMTIKPVLYGSLAARTARVPAVVNSMYGLGRAFSDRGLRAAALRSAVTRGLRTAFAAVRPRHRVTFENGADAALFQQLAITRADEVTVIRGMGYDPVAFAPRPQASGVPVVMMAGRLLRSKGVEDLVEAMRRVRAAGIPGRLVLVGTPDAGNPDGITDEVLRSWQAAGDAEWWGRREDMPEVIAGAAIVALPSRYGEGLPKILIEAAGAGRALIASDIPGCREVVHHGQNGLLVPPGDVEALVRALAELLSNPSMRADYGLRGHALARPAFADEVVNRETMRVYDTLLVEAARGCTGAPANAERADSDGPA